MRSLLSQVKNSCMSLLGRAETTPESLYDRTEDIRELILTELGEYAEKNHSPTARRVRYASDVQGLWYLRSEVMSVLAKAYGETIAEQKLASISRQFNGLVPQSLMGVGAGRPR